MAILTDSFGGIDVVPKVPHGLELYTTTGELESRTTTVIGIAGIGNVSVVNDYLFDLTYLPAPAFVPGSYTTLFFNDTVVTQTTATYNITVPQGGALSATGQQDFTTVGTTSWVVPANVYSISAVVVGGGGGGSAWTSGGGGGRGGDLRYAISIPVTPGETLTITVGAGGIKALTAVAGSGGFSNISRGGTSLLQAAGGAGGSSSSGFGATLGTSTPTSANIGGGTGGTHAAGGTTNTSGGGGAAGYTGNGGNSGVGAVAGSAGAGGGGGGGGGGGSGGTGASGGGVGIYGLGANGAAGASGAVGLGGSGGTDGNASTGGVYGGGGGGSDAATLANAKDGGQGAVRIIYGEGRTYPSTRTVDQELFSGLPATTASIYSTSTIVDSYEYVKYPTNTLVKISDPTLAYSTITQVTSAGRGYLTIATPAGFPTTETGSMILQGASPSVYTRAYAFNSYQQTQYEVTSVQDSLAAAVTSPNIRGSAYFIDRNFSDTLPLVSSTTSKLSVFTDSRIPGDFRTQLTGQTPDAFNLTVPWYVYEQDQLANAVNSTATTKTVYFGNTEALLFNAGSTVRIKNQLSGYVGEFVVTSATNYSVSFDKPVSFTDTSGAIIERTESTVYPQSYVSTTVAPTNARENLYYFTIGAGIRASQPYKFTTKDQLNAGTINRIFRPLHTTPSIVHGKLSSAAKLKAEGTRLVPTSLVSPKLVVKSFNDKLTTEKLSTPKIVVKYPEAALYKVDALNKAKLRNFAEIVSVSTLTNTVNELSQFDNIENLIQGPIYNITGQAFQSVNNAVLTYIFDEDILVTSNTPITELTLYFYNSRETVFSPYPIGSYVTVFNTVGRYTTQVRNAGSNFVTLDLPIGYSNESYTTIASSTLDIIPAIDYKPVIIGTAPRDAYYFSQLSPSKGFIYNDTIRVFESHRAILSSAVLSKPISKLTSLPDVLTTESLSKQLSKMIADRAVLTTDKLNVASIVRADGVRIQSTQLEKPIVTFKETNSGLYVSSYVNRLRVDQTQMFETPSVSKVSAAIVVRADNTLLKVEPVRSITKLVNLNVDIAADNLEKKIIRLDFDDTSILTVSHLDPAKFKADMAQVFDLPSMFNLEKQLVTIRSDNTGIFANALQKPITAMRTDNTVLFANTLKNMSPVLTDRVRLKSNEYITRLRVDQTQMFETPLSSKLTAMSKLVGNPNYHKVFKLTAGAVVKETISVPQVFKNTRFKVDRTHVFFTPDSGKLKSMAAVRADTAVRSIGNLKAMTVIKSPVAADRVSTLQKQLVNVTDIQSILNSYHNDQFYAQSLVRTTSAPTNPRENLYYYQLAPGYRYNRTIEQGNTFSPSGSIIEASRLEMFDNVGLTDGPTFTILGQDTGQISNTVLEYIFDLDILTAVTTPVSALTVYINNLEFVNPYPVGSYVSMTKINDPLGTYVFQVVGSTFNTVTTALPTDWDSTWIWGTISSASSPVYPRTSVRTSVAPTNAREMLYYAELATGYKTNSSIEYGLTFADLAINAEGSSGNLERDYYRLREVKDSLFLAAMVKSAGVLRGFRQVLANITPGKVLPRSNIRGIPQNLLQSKFGLLERVIWGKNPNFGTRFAEVIRLEARGSIIRLKTGTFNKVHDIAVKKKEPIQFWN